MSDNYKIPRHIAIIMDGNGRWAKERGLERTAGHKEGIKRLKEIVAAAAERGVKVLTFFAFSTENWKRPKSEVNMLMRFLDDFLAREVKELHKKKMRFRVIGEEPPLAERTLRKIREAEEKTKENTGMTVVLALNYGSRQEIIRAAKDCALDCLSGKVEPGDLQESLFSRYL
jgi:undecaprenyl diphosphate synthase